jgi:phosphoglycerate dehydrogenase-like enzyme
MGMNVVILSSELDPHEFKSYLTSDFSDVTFLAARKESEIENFIEEADVLVTHRISDSLLSRAKKLKWIHCTITGTDYIEGLSSFQTRKDIILTSSRGIHGPQMSEFAIMLMVALNRQLPRLVRNQDRRVWERWSSPVLQDKKVCILGVGAIGQAIAEKCKVFQMTVFGVDPCPRKTDAVDEFYGPDKLHLVLPKVDYLISVLPSTPKTRNMLDREAFSKMKRTAFFINLGRGDVVEEDALVQALKDREIAGAALDTFRQEPLPQNHHFWSMDNVLISPHVGGRSDTYTRKAAEIFQDNLRRFLEGRKADLINLISRR